MADYRATLEAVMVQVEKATPNASWMLVGPPDAHHAEPAVRGLELGPAADEPAEAARLGRCGQQHEPGAGVA